MGQFLKHPSRTSNLSPEDKKKTDEERKKKVLAEQAKLPWWRRLAIDAIGLPGRMLTDTNDAEEPFLTEAGKWLGFGGQVATAGLPGPQLMKKLGINKVLHGSKNLPAVVEKGFDPKVYNTGDTLGWMTHFAERPGYASEFIGLPVKNYPNFPIDPYHHGRGIIPAEISGQYAMDAFDPDLEDITRIAANFPNNRVFNTKRDIGKHLLDVKNDEYRLPRDKEKIIRGYLEEMGPERVKAAGIDAVRYDDAGETAWALAHPSAARNALTKEPLPSVPSLIPKNLQEQLELPEGAGVLVRNRLHHPSKVKEIKHVPGKGYTYSDTGKPEGSPFYSTPQPPSVKMFTLKADNGEIVDTISATDLYGLYPQSKSIDEAKYLYALDTQKKWKNNKLFWGDSSAQPDDSLKSWYQAAGLDEGYSPSSFKSKGQKASWSKPTDRDVSVYFNFVNSGKNHDSLSFADLAELYPNSKSSEDAVYKYIDDLNKVTGSKLTWSFSAGNK